METVLPLYVREEGNGTQCLLESVVTSSTVTTLSSTLSGTPSGGAVYGSITLKPSKEEKKERKENAGLWLAKKASNGYLSALEESPLRTKCASYAVLMCIADVVAQFVSAGLHDFDWYRTVCMMLIGTLFTAPVYHYMYDLLEEVFPSTKPVCVAAQVVTDQLVIAPMWTMGYLALLSLLQHGPSWSTLVGVVKESFMTVIGMSWAVYPVVQVVNFTFVPKGMRVLVVAGVGMIYSIFVSVVTHRA